MVKRSLEVITFDLFILYPNSIFFCSFKRQERTKFNRQNEPLLKHFKKKKQFQKPKILDYLLDQKN